jgi:Holliday junction resolvase RusA-like endonuclease
MSAFMQFEVFGQPQPQGSSRAFVNKKTGRAIVTSSNPNLKDWRDLIAREARDQMNGLPPLDGAVTVNATFFLPRPKSVKRSDPTVKPDLDKLLRAVLDGLTNIVYRDDAQVVNANAQKLYVSEITPHPCALIEVLS